MVFAHPTGLALALAIYQLSVHAQNQIPLTSSHPGLNANPVSLQNEPYFSKYGEQRDMGFTGPLSFGHLPYTKCLEDPATPNFDIAFLGFPFDTTTSYRPGARFGPAGIRHGSRRLSNRGGYTLSWGNGPHTMGSAIRDCGDVPLSISDNMKAIDQMEMAYLTLLQRTPAAGEGFVSRTKAFALDEKEHPRIITLGGDHTIVLPILRSLNKVYGPVSVIHFDAHLDTWSPDAFNLTGKMSEQERITHGTFFAIAHEEGLIRNDSSVHAGVRCRMGGIQDIDHDSHVGFSVISTDDIDDYGIDFIIHKMRERIGNSPVYLTLDIDVVDPGLAPATGTPESGGWTTREVKRILRGLAGLNIVGADLVEVAPAYDHADITSIAAADFIHDFLMMMQVEGPPAPHKIII
ncbi:arginase family-domain-containing protein [Flagelloscypha sp. PMI_526]|nr:arginase family-domain-containing protein [Flagelloscypha sp. PMI_526]